MHSWDPETGFWASELRTLCSYFQKMALGLINLSFVFVAALLILSMFMSISLKSFLLSLLGITMIVSSLFWVQLLTSRAWCFFS